MRLSSPRVPPKERHEWSEAEQQLMQPFVDSNSDHNVFKTMLHHPDLFSRWLVFAKHILFKTELSKRDCELVILRTGHLCRAGYEWSQHEAVGRRAGLDDADINACRHGPDTPGISEADRLLLTATDELHRDKFVSDATWAGLKQHFEIKQIMDLVFAVGQYTLVSMALNTFGVQLDEGIKDTWQDLSD